MYFIFIYLFIFLGSHPWHTEVPRLGVKSELQLWTYTTAIATQNLSRLATYTTAHSNTRSLTHWARPRIEPATLWLLVRFMSTVPQWELLCFIFKVRVLYRMYGDQLHQFAWDGENGFLVLKPDSPRQIWMLGYPKCST